jgi:hypothetical protein
MIKFHKKGEAGEGAGFGLGNFAQIALLVGIFLIILIISIVIYNKISTP